MFAGRRFRLRLRGSLSSPSSVEYRTRKLWSHRRRVLATTEGDRPVDKRDRAILMVFIASRDRAELVTDDKPGLREQLEAVTGERIAALEAVKPERAKGRVAGLDADRSTGLDGAARESRQPERTSGPDMEKARAPKRVDRDLGL